MTSPLTPTTAIGTRWFDNDAAIRAIDIVGSLALLVLVAPLMLAVAIIIRSQSSGPILFRQRRIGLRGRSFLCLKFRTMLPDAQDRLRVLLATDPVALAEWQRDHKLRNDPRITRFGSFLRKSSIDELPQLFNVLRGEMSLVGPRPVTAEETARYRSRYWTYCTVRPGITGLWQISGRNDVSYRRRIAMDAVYARQLSLRLYLKVLFNTAPALLASRGAY